MTTRPTQADGPQTHEYDPPVTLGERIAVSDNNFDTIGAVCFSRRWNTEAPRSRLSPWQQIGPEMLWAASRITDADLHKIGPMVSDYVSGLTWVVRKKLSRLQIELAVYDAFVRVVHGDCDPAYLSALRVACRKETFLDMRAEAAAFMVYAMGMAAANMKDEAAA